MEEVLTTYTKLNRSASIFLGGNSKTNQDRPPPRPASQAAPNAAGAVTEPALPRRREMSEESLDTRALEEGSTGNSGRAGRMNLGKWAGAYRLTISLLCLRQFYTCVLYKSFR